MNMWQPASHWLPRVDQLKRGGGSTFLFVAVNPLFVRFAPVVK